MKTHEVLNKLFEAEQEALVPADLKAKGWVYRDMPGRTTPEGWDKLIQIMGEGNYKLIIVSEGYHNGSWKRGQFLLSPQAIENMKKYREDKKNESNSKT